MSTPRQLLRVLAATLLAILGLAGPVTPASAAPRPQAALRLLMIVKPRSTAPGWSGNLTTTQISSARTAFLVTWPKMITDLSGGQVQAETSVQVSPDTLTSSSPEGIARPEDLAGDVGRWVRPGEWDGVLVYNAFRAHAYWTLGGPGPANVGWSSVNARDDLDYDQDAVAGWTHEVLHGLSQFYYVQKALGPARTPQCTDDPGHVDGVHCGAAYGYTADSGGLPFWLGWYRDFWLGRIGNGSRGLGPAAWAKGNRRETVLNRPPGSTIPQTTGPISGIAGQCVDIAAGGQDNATAVQLWTCNGAPVQQWNLETDGSIRAMGRCLDVPGGRTGNGTPLWVYDCNGSVFQQWQARADGTLYNPNSGRCLDAPGGQVANGTRLQIWDCLAGANQQWRLPA